MTIRNATTWRRALAILVLGAGAVASQACVGTTEVDESEGTESADDALKTVYADDAIARAMEWVKVELHYCQAPNHATDYDPACSSTCNRHANKQWDPYRSDCSGLISWAWGLPAPGRVTGNFAPFQTDITHAITADKLQPGDAVNNATHVMLFKRWNKVGHEAVFIEEPGCSSATPYAHEFTSSVSTNGSSIYVSHNGETFTAIRYDAIKAGGGKQAPKGDTTAQEEATLQAFELDDSGSTDVDGDGRADVCTFNGSHIACYLSKGDGFGQKVDGPELDGDDFDKAAGFSSIRWADIDGNGKADLCLRKSDGVVCWRSNGQGFGKAIHTGVMADKDGWTDKDNWATFRLADVDGDGKADICARNDKEFKCWLSHGDGFGAGIAGPAWDSDSAFGERASWGTLRMADVNGDGKADVCAKNHEGIVCWLSNGHGFNKKVKGPDLDQDAFMDADNWGTIRFADIDGDGKADVCARKNSGFSCWKSHGDAFGNEIHGPELSNDNGWDDHDNWSTIRLADINGDGKADLCARANSGLECWLSSGHGFGKRIDVGTLANDAGGDHPDQYRTIRFADVDGDGKQDLCYRKGDGLHCRISAISGGKDGFKAPFDGPAFSDDNKYDEEERYTAIAITGP